MEVNKLSEDELRYELKVRGFEGVESVDQMRILLRGLLKTSNNSYENYVILDAKQEINTCVSKIRELKEYVDGISGTKLDESYRVADTKLCHLLGRVDRIITDDEKLQKTRTILLKTVLHLMREMEAKVQPVQKPVKTNFENVVPVDRTLTVTKRKMHNADEYTLPMEDVGIELFSHQGVALKKTHSEYRAEPVPGTLSILQYKGGKWIEWKATEVSFDSENADSGWDVVDARRRTCSTSSNVETCQLAPTIRIAMKNLRSYKIKKHGTQISLIDNNNMRYSFLFQCGNSDSFINCLRAILVTRRAGHSKNIYVVMDEREESKLTKSFNELKLFPDTSDQRQTYYLWNFVQNLHNRPYETTMQTFSKLTDAILYRAPEQRPDEEVAELLTKSLHADDSEKTLEADYTIIEGGSNITLTPRPNFIREKPLSHVQWTSFLDSEGRVTNPDAVKYAVFKGGIEPQVKAEVWKYLLNYYPWNYTQVECDALREEKQKEYFVMKNQWKTMTRVQEERFSGFRERKSLIEKDVNRTDRTIPFYAGEDNANLTILYDILMTYVMYNFDLGYVQGMNDLLSPILFLIGNEVDAFWCFAGFMDRVCNNFDLDQAGMKKQLSELYNLLKVVVPDLAQYLNKHESANMFFCFRWLLVLFKREFTYEEIMTLWEVLWTDMPCVNFHLLMCVAILDTEKSKLMKPENGFTEILKYINELSLRMNLQDIIVQAEGIYYQLKEAGDKLPISIRRIVGLAPAQENDSENSDEELCTSSRMYPTLPSTSSHKNSDDNDSLCDDMEKVTLCASENGDIGFEEFERSIALHYY